MDSSLIILSRIILVAVLASTAATSAREPFFTGIGDLPGGAFVSGCGAISSDGRVAACDSNVGGISVVGAVWTEEFGIQHLLPTNGLLFPTADGISGDGRVIVGTVLNDNGRSKAHRWTADEGLVLLGDLPGGAFESDAHAASFDGSVIVGLTDTLPGMSVVWRGFRWTPQAGVEALSKLAGGDNFTVALDVSDDGSIIVGQSGAAGGHQAVIWTAPDEIEALGDLPGGRNESFAGHVSGDGHVIIGRGNDAMGPAPFRWTREGGMVPFHRPIDHTVTGYFLGDLSCDGNVIVGSVNPRDIGVQIAIIWDAQHGTRIVADVLADLELPIEGWHFSDADGVSSDGRTIAGDGINPQGFIEGWVAYLGEIPPPCPGDMDDDGVLGLSDLGHLLEHFGETFNASPADGDLDLDTDIDIHDLALLLSNFGNTCPP